MPLEWKGIDLTMTIMFQGC